MAVVKLVRYGIGREFMVFSRHIRRKPGLPLCRHGARMCLISVIMTRPPKSADLTALAGFCRGVSRRVPVLTRRRFEPFKLSISKTFTFCHLKVLHLRINDCICYDYTKKCIFLTMRVNIYVQERWFIGWKLLTLFKHRGS